jgi:hypothetical protein
MPVDSAGNKPEGFQTVLRLDPKPGEDGVIRDDAPLKVRFDLCATQPGVDNKPLTFLYDFDSNGVADAVDSGDDCQREHVYRTNADPGKEVAIESNVCVVSGDPAAHGPNTYFSCRRVKLALKAPRVSTLSCHDLCVAGALIDPGCGSCAAQICAADSWCCTVNWDGICIGQVWSVCGSSQCQNTVTNLDLSAALAARRSGRP